MNVTVNDHVVSAKDARNLAVAYQAYLEAHAWPDCDPSKANTLKVWARILYNTQRDTGIVLLSRLQEHFEE